MSKEPIQSFFRCLYLHVYLRTMPLHSWMITGKGVKRAYRELKQTDFCSKDKLVSVQEMKLQSIVEYAYENSVFYRDRFDALGLSPKDINSISDLTKIPLLSKHDVRENLYSGLLVSGLDKKDILKINTSGSTGEPFTIFADREQLEYRFATTMRSAEWTGWRIGNRQARLWHQTLGMSKTQALREKIDAIFLRRMFIPAFEVDSKSILKIINKLNRKKPVLLDGYAESLNLIASFLNQSNIEIKFQPKAIMSSAQALPDETRMQIERAFKSKVFDKYGSREFSGIAYECMAHKGHHVMEESYIVELLVNDRAARPGEIGEVVITDLLNRAVPMIRYRIGDLAVAMDNETNCDCGRSHMRIGRIEGRTQAIVHCANGTWLPGTFFAHFFKGYEDCVRFFQIHQSQKGEFELKMVKGSGFSIEKFDELMRNLRKYVSETRIDVVEVDEIPMVRTGKRSPVVSLIIDDFQSIK
jgi:phenylacetate-CoA ligase